MDPDSLWYLISTAVIISPPGTGAIVALVLALLLLGVSGYISASEIAFFSLTPNQKSEIEEEKNSADTTIIHLLSKSDYLLATILIANNLVNVSVIMLCNYFISHTFTFLGASWIQFLVQTVTLTFLLLLFGEIMPKIYASSNTLGFVRFSAPILSTIFPVFKPIAHLLVLSTSAVNKHITKQNSNLSMDVLSQALEVTSVEATDEKALLEGIIKFGDKTVAEIMTSRMDVVAIDISASFAELITIVKQMGFSRMPVYETTEDTIKGVIFIKDILPYLNEPDNFAWQRLMRSAYFVPETKMIDNLLEEFRTNKNHLAIVVDEYGGTSGIVSLEDILEEIVGEIRDEYDDESKQHIKLNETTYIFEAKVLLTDFFRITNIDDAPFEKYTEEVETLAGLILEIKEGFPVAKEQFEYGGCLFTVIEMDKRRIIKIKVEIK